MTLSWFTIGPSLLMIRSAVNHFLLTYDRGISASSAEVSFKHVLLNHDGIDATTTCSPWLCRRLTVDRRTVPP